MIALVIVVGLCLCFEAFFSGSELALLAADRIQLQARADQGGKRGWLIARFLNAPQDLIATSLIGTNICVVVSTVSVTLYMLAHNRANAELVSVAVMTPLVLVIGEIVPKSVFQAHADAVAPRVIYVLSAIYTVFSPVVWLASRLSGVFLRALGISEQRPFMTRDELRLLLRLEGKAQAGQHPITEDERGMISSIFELRDKTVEDVMLPLSEVFALPDKTTIDDATLELSDKHYSRLPVYQDRVHKVTGVVHVFDLLRAPAGARTLQDVARKPVFVPEHQPITVCLRGLQREHQGMAIVVNEYGGAEGVVTIEDILEEVVGDIEDEYDPAPPVIRQQESGVWLVLGRAPITTVNEELSLELPESEEDYETIAGLVLYHLKRIPRDGDSVVVGPVSISVTKATPRSVDEVRIGPRGRMRRTTPSL